MTNIYNSLCSGMSTSHKNSWLKKTALLLFFVMFSVFSVQGQVTVSSTGGNGTGNGSYSTLGAAFTALGTTATGAITITISGNTTEAAGGATLGAGTWTSITIAPSGGPWTVSGAATAGSPLINFNGADNVTVNGGNNLTFSNTTVSSTSGTSTLKLGADATNNTFNNVTILGSASMATGTNGGNVWISTGTTTGNDGNSFQSCKFGPAGSNLPSVLFYGNGSTTSTAIENSGITVNNCEFYDYFQAAVGSAAIYMSTGNTGWTVTNNKVYQTATRTITTSSTIYGIYMVNTGSTALGESYTVTGNTIGYANNSGTGTMTYAAGTTAGGFTGINFSASTSATSTNNINNNIISNIQWTSTGGSTFNGISTTGLATTTAGQVLNVNGNTVRNIATITTTGAMTGITSGYSPTTSISNNTIDNLSRTAASTLYAIQYAGGASTSVTLNNNTISNIAYNVPSGTSNFYVMYSVSAPATETITNNTINGISSTATGAQTICGIYNNTAAGTKTITGNTLTNFSLPSTSTGTIYGIRKAFGGTTDNVSGNNVNNFSGGTTIYGINIGAGTTVNTFNNKVYGLGSSVAGATVYGMYVTGGTTHNIYNNIVGNLTASAATGSNAVAGIYLSSGTTDNLYYNTVYLNGTSSGSGFGSSAVYASTTPTVDFRNNIFDNATTPTGSGLAVAYRRSSTTLTTYASTSNNNLFFGTSGIMNDGTTTYNSSGYQTLVSTRDTASKFQNPAFASTTGSDSTFLHFVSGGVNLAGANGAVVSGYTTDFDGDARDGSTPDIGADEWANGTISPPTITGFSTPFSPSAPIYLCSNGGSVVTITGTNLDTVSSVLFNGSSAVDLPGTITGQTATTLTVISPASVVDGIIRVTNPAGSGDSSSVFATANPPTVGVSSSVAICSGTSTSLTATGANTYAWTPSLGLNGTTSATVVANPSATTTYTVTGTSTAGCTATNTVTVTVNPTPSAIGITKNPNIACMGNTTTLTTTGGTIGGPTTATLGAGASTSTSSGISMFSGGWGGLKTQYIIRASELTALGLVAGNPISSVAFEATSAFNGYEGFALNVGLTSATTGALPLITTGLTQVYTGTGTNGAYATTVGVNTLNFSTPLVWDGTSNIVLSFCWAKNPAASSTTSSSVKYDTASFVCTAYGQKDLTLPASFCPLSASADFGTSGTSSSRPKFTFGYSNAVATTFAWTPTTDLYTNAGATTSYAGENLNVVYSKSTTPQTYTVTSTLGSCAATQTVTVTPNALPTVATSNAARCTGDSGVALLATGATNYAWTPTTGLNFADIAGPTATPASTTTYTVTGTDANGCTNTATSTVTVNTAVAITTQPAQQAVAENTSATFSVTATGTGLTYQWQTLNGSTWDDISGETASSYTIASAPLSLDGKQYRVVVSGTAPCAPVTSSAATLLVSSVGITSQPANQTICSDASAVYSITASGSVTSYQWQYSTNGGTTWSDVDGQTTATLTLSGLSTANNGTIVRCSVNAGQVYSNTATLTVYDAVVIGTQPANASVCSGTNATFTAAATGSGLSYQWQFSTNGGTSWTNVGTNANSLTVTAPTGTMNGYLYHVVVSGTAPCAAVTSASATLTVTDVTVAASSSNICIGASATLTATFVGSPDYTTATWTSTAGSGAATPVSGASASVTPTAAGTYTYTFASNGTCPFSKTTSVIVNALPNITSATATPAAVCSGATINLAAASIPASNGTAALGAGALTASTTSNGISPFSYNWGGTKTQYLIKASELTALGFIAGNLTSLAFETTSVGQTYTGFSLSINSTSATALTTTFLPNGTQVYLGTLTNNGYLPVANSVNTLNFGTGSGSASSFAWDGTSNIIVTFSWSTVPNATNAVATPVKYDTTSFVSTTYKQADNTSPTDMLAQPTGSTLSSRPKFTFGGLKGTNLTSTYTWSWNSSPAVTTATGTTSVTNTSGSAVTQTFTATATSATGCTSSLTTSNVTINSTIPTPTGTDNTQCGTGTPTCSVTGSGRSGNTFRWYTVATNGTAISGQSGSTLVAPYTISATTTFYVSEYDGLCESDRVAVTQTVTSPFAFTLSSGTATNCSGSPSLTPVTIATNGGYTSYSWSNNGTVSGNETTGWYFAPTATTTYTVTATGGGCSTTASVVVTPTVLPVLYATASPAAICTGASSTLTALTDAVAAGTATIGAGATTTATYSNPFYSLWSNNHTQHLITAAELTAMGLKPGNITSVGLNVTSAGTLPMIDLSVKIGATTATSMTAFANNSGFQTVYTNASLMPTTGVNTLTFSTPFNWDGTSNIILEFCHGNSGSSATMSRTVLADNTSYVSSIKVHVSAATAAATICGDTTTNLTSYSLRPVFIFNGQVASQGVGTLAYTWNDPSATTGNVVTVSPSSTTTYTVSGYNSTTGCTGTKNVTVTVFSPPTAPTATNGARCNAGVVTTATVADTNGYTTPTFKWYDTDQTTVLQTSTSTSYTTSISATKTLYVSVVSPGGCESPQTAITLTINTPATITAAASPSATICTGGSTTLTASGAVSYTWAPALGLNGTTSASVVATPADTTVYSVTGVDTNGCTTAAATITVTVNAYPTAVTASAGSASVCEGGTINLTASATAPGGGLVNLSEGFETFPPTGWTFINVGPSANSWATSTTARTGSKSMSYTYDSVNTANAANTWAITPGQALKAGVTYTVTYWEKVISSSFPENLKLTVGTAATVAGQTTTLLTQAGLTNTTYALATATFTPSTSGTYYFALNCYSAPDEDVLYVDDFAITGGTAAPTLTYAWTSTPSGFTSSDQNPTGVVSNETRTYTVTASNGSCGVSATTSSVTFNPAPVFSLNGTTTICKGQSTTLTATGETGLTYSWSPSTGLDFTNTASVSANPMVTTTYTVEATNAAGCKSTHTITVTVLEPGAIVSATESQIAIADSSTTFTVVTASGPSYTYEWQMRINASSPWTSLSDDTYYSGTNTATLTISNIITDFDGYQYQCLVTAEAPCTALTPIVGTLTVSDTGIAQQPQSVTVCAPGTASFSVVTSGSEPYGIQWQMSTDNGVTYNDIIDGLDATGLTFSGVNDLTLNVSGITTANTGVKFLVVLNFFLSSSSATLTVKEPVAITSQPANQTVCASGGTATFAVTATGDNLGYQWEFSTNGGTSWANYTGTGAITSSISIVNPAVSAEGTQYRVVVSGNAACSSVTSDPATLHINNPTITAQPVAATVLRGNTATFAVTASSATTYQWQRSTTLNGTYTDVVDDTPTGNTYSGATSATLTVATSATTVAESGNFYRCVATNGLCSATSTGAQLTVNWYCTPAPTSVDGTGITNVTMGDINNTTGDETGHYGDYTAQSTTAARLSTVNFGITYATGFTYDTKIWIDFNDNGDFTDAGENVYTGVSLATNPTTLSGSFTLPLTAPLGSHRMRVGGVDVGPPTPCWTSSFGSFEDYTINVTAAPTCSGTPTAGTASTTSTALCSGGIGATLSLAGYTTGVAGISLQWYYSSNGTTFAAVSGATNATLDTGSLTADAYYYCTVSCSESGLSANSNTVTITVNNPLITGSTPDGRCGTGTVTLQATANAGSVVNWYAAATNGVSLGTGTSFTTPSISTTTTYYAEASTATGLRTASGLGNTSTPTATGATAERGIVFTATSNGTIVSAQYYSPTLNVTNTATVRLVDNATGNQIGSSLILPIVQGATAGFYTMNLNLPVTAGTTYRLLAGFSSSVNRISSGANYATAAYNNLGSLGTITSGYDSGVSTTSYNYFHNIVANVQGCVSARTAVTATVTPKPTATISYAGTPFCSTDGIKAVSLNGTNAYTGGTFSSTAGLSINASSGAIDVAGSTPGTYTVTYAIPDTGYCTGLTATTSVTINQALTSGFSYDAAVYCSNGGTVTPTMTGTAGTFTSSPAGLTINSSTGVITLATSAAGTYTVTNTVVVAGCSNSITSQTVTVNAAVAITSQPVSVSQLPGDNTSFSATATGTGLTYQWQVNDGSGFVTISGETSATLNLTAVTIGMNGYQYQVIVSGTSPCGSVTSSAATLTVDTAAISGQPANFTACSAGANTATFAITTTGDVTSYQWQYSTNGGSTWADATGANYSGDTTASLAVSGITLTDNGTKFRCVVNTHVNSNAATLTVKQAVAIGTQPAATAGCSAGSASFTVAATGDNLTYQWQFSTNGGSTWSNAAGASATTATLSLSSLTASMNGYQYKVIVSGASPCSAVTSSAAILTVNTVVAITTQPANTTACNGANATFTVAATGTGLGYQWQFSTNGGTTFTDISGATSASLTVNAVTTAMNGYKYRVTVSGAAPCGSVTSNGNATLTVDQPAAPVVTPVTACLGSATPLSPVATYANSFDAATDFTLGGTGSPTAVANTTFKSEGSASVRFNTTSTSVAATYTMTSNLNLSGLSNQQLTFSHQAIMEGPTTSFDYGYVEYSSDGGTTWVTFPTSSYVGTAASAVFTAGNTRFTTKSYADWITNFTSTSSLPNNTLWKTETFNIPAAALTSQFKLRFRYTTDSSANYYGWMIDNVAIGSGNSITWSPTTGLYTDAAATTAYTGTAANKVYAKPLATTTYTVTATNSLGCTNASSVTVTVPASSTLSSITQPTITCSGSQTTFNLTGLLPSSTSTLGYTINGVAQTAITGVIADASGNASFTLALAAANNGKTLAITSITRTDLTPSCTTTISANNTVTIQVQPLVTYYADADGDGHGNNAVTQVTCQGQPAGYVTNNTDCDDTNAAVYQTTHSSTVSACDSYTWSGPVGNGTTYTTSGTYTYTTTNASGCTNIETLVLTINASTAHTTTVTACDSYTWAAPLGTGTTYSASGTYTHVSANAAGCDHTETLVLTINNSTTSTETVTSPTCGTYTWSVNGQTYTASGTYTYTGTNAAGCTDTKILVLTIDPCPSSVVTVKMNIEGYYDTATHAMRPVLTNQGVGSSATDVDTVTIELHDATTYALVATTTAMLQTDGNAVATFAPAQSGSFYIAVKHRNTIETWSAAPQSVGSTPLTYDFTNAANKAMGDNMVMLETGVYGLYSGDINQDTNIDGIDFSQWESDYNDLNSGYYATDLNGDGNVDGIDFSIWEANYNNLIYSVKP